MNHYRILMEDLKKTKMKGKDKECTETVTNKINPPRWNKERLLG